MAPKRKNVRKIFTSELQGDGSYLIFKTMTVGEREDLVAETRAHLESRRVDDAIEPEADPAFLRALGERVIGDHITEWNWVDDDDQPLPLPKDDISVLRKLTDDEMTFVSDLFNPERPGQKK